MKSICTLVLLVVTSAVALAADDISSRLPLTIEAEIEVVESSSHRTLLKVTPCGRAIHESPLRGGLANADLERSVVSTLIGIPVGADVSVRVISAMSKEGNRVPVDGIAEVKTIGIMRGVEIAQLLVYPEQREAVTEELHTYTEIVVELRYTGHDGSYFTKPSFAFDPIYRALLTNYPDREAELASSLPGGYLVIVPDEYYDAIQPLAEWKRLKGWKTTVSKLSEVGSNAEQIKTYIKNAYNTWDPSPEYVLLVGDVDQIPGFYYPQTITDHPYSLLDGEDYLSDVLVGRISVSSSGEVEVVVNKILGYEKTPYLAETDWYKKALMVAGNYPAGVTTATSTKKWVRDLLLSHGYTQVDTVFYPPVVDGGIPISAAVNDGVAFVNFRGWSNYHGWHYPQYYEDDVQSLSNGRKLPFVTGISCATGNFNAPLCFGEAWLRAGTPTNPKGGIGSYGPSTAHTHTKFNNCIDHGIYWGIFMEDLSGLGQACYRGKLELCENFPTDTIIGNYFYYYNLLGDPSLVLWTDVPESLQVQHLESVAVGTNFFEVTVHTNSKDASPLSGALVSLLKEGEVEIAGLTDGNGRVSFPVTISTPDTMRVTVTARNSIPYVGYTLVQSTDVCVGVEDFEIDDSRGNGDGNVNPGELIGLTINLKNFGATDTAYNVLATLTSSDGFVSLIDSARGFGDIAPEGVANCDPCSFVVAAACTNGHVLSLDLNITSGANNWASKVNIPVNGLVLTCLSYEVLDGDNGILDPGETAELEVLLGNSGELGLTGVQAILRSGSEAVVVPDSQGAFGDIVSGDSADNSGNKFTVKADSLCAVGREIGFALIISGQKDLTTVVRFSLVIGQVDSTAPLGPDKYGYYAYDNTDVNYDESPVYDWVEIDPEYGGSGTALQLGNLDTEILSLPFTFRFYGNDYTRICVCSNGWICMDSTGVTEAYNWHIPSSMGPHTVVAPFWDYLDPTAEDSGSVVYYEDNTNHRFIVEWSRIHNVHELPPTPPTPSAEQTFQAILLDPSHYPTKTGDGEMIFQYHTVVNDDTCHNYCTVGIEDAGLGDGIEYTFNNAYPQTAAILCSERAIKFTTDPPDTFHGVEEEDNYQLSIGNGQLSIYPNPFIHNTVVEFRVRGSEFVDEKPLTFKIYDLGGRLVEETRGNSVGKGLEAGIYFLKVKGHDPVKMVKLR